MDVLSRSIGGSPELFPHALDLNSDSVAFVRLSEADYRTASFLDDRIVTPQTLRRLLPWTDVRRATEKQDFSEACDFIFHIGHTGSTLLSRLLGAQPGVFPVREPAILRMLAQIRGEPDVERRVWGKDGFEPRLAALLKLWSRTFRPGDRSVVKATSFVSELAAELVSRPHKPRAILMFVSPERYLATILGGANAPREARLLAPERLKRLRRRLGEEIADPAALGIGEIVAMSWACEMTALVAARETAGEQALPVDFDMFLRNPLDVLSTVFRHLLIPFCRNDIVSLIGGPDMRRYSKAPEYAYDASVRAEVLDRARAVGGAEIRRGLAWLDTMSHRYPQVAAARTLAG